ncbi:MAG: WecB/TagA/CpsF family glycosyltransferase [Spirochaetaceae bacterium]|nr:WecB/TagA/CpsF family glycosyltransferase [Spirochaetaceae bacterium]
METTKSEQQIEQLDVLKVPLNNVDPNYMPAVIRRLIDTGGAHNITLLSVWDLLRARRNKEYRAFVLNASLVLPISTSLVKGTEFLTGIKPAQYIPFDFLVKLLIAIDERELSLYILGGSKKVLKKVERNIRQTFLNLHIVGRYTGYYRKRDEPTIIQAIKKASPTLLLVGKGVRGGERWIARNTDKVGPGIRIWCSDLYDIFAKRKRRPPYILFDHGLEWLWFLPYKFLYVLRVFPFMYYKILLIIYKFFKKKKMKPQEKEESDAPQ